MADVVVMGAGAMGTATSYLLAKNGNSVLVWTRRKEICSQINRNHQNPEYLHGFVLPEGIVASTNLRRCIENADIIVLAVPSHAIRGLCLRIRPHLPSKCKWLSVGKGITLPDCLTSAEILNSELGLEDENIAALSGPNFAAEIVKNVPTISVIGSKARALASLLSRLLENEYFIVRTTTDLRGVEISGAFKNVGAIAIGIADGLDFGDNTRGLILSYYLEEILQIGTRVFGAKPETLLGYACLGDMITTSFSNKSRNRIIGLLASKHVTKIPRNSYISEGKNTAEALITLASKYNLEMPTTRFVYSILNGENPLSAFNTLFKHMREPGYETKG